MCGFQASPETMEAIRKLPIFKGAREVEDTWFALQQSEVMHGIIANLLIPPSARMLGNQRLPLIDTHLITRAFNNHFVMRAVHGTGVVVVVKSHQ
jgi:hypothetical protein